MKRFKNQKPVRFVKKELKEFDRDIKKFGSGQFIFVGSSCDMFAKNINEDWIMETLWKCIEYEDKNRFFFQSKDVDGLHDFINYFPKKSILCTTIESNRFYKDIMIYSPEPKERHLKLQNLLEFDNNITIEPILDFDLREFFDMLTTYKISQINIGADSGNNNLPEPSKEKIIELITELKKFTKVHLKSNLNRLIK